MYISEIDRDKYLFNFAYLQSNETEISNIFSHLNVITKKRSKYKYIYFDIESDNNEASTIHYKTLINFKTVMRFSVERLIFVSDL